jgi:hypothetical protein
MALVATGLVAVDCVDVVTFSSCPKAQPIRCRPHHTSLVMNVAARCLLSCGYSGAPLLRQHTLIRRVAGCANQALAAQRPVSSPFQSPNRALYRGGQYFPSLVVLGTQG